VNSKLGTLIRFQELNLKIVKLEERTQRIPEEIEAHRQTLEEVGQRFSVTRERIRQIEAKALRKLRHPSRTRKLKTFLENMSKEGL